jgi:hypothetical protein
VKTEIPDKLLVELIGAAVFDRCGEVARRRNP